MASFCRVIVAGNVTRDIEIKYTQGGMAIADIGLAVNEKRKVNGEWVDEASFFDVTMFGRTAEIASEYLGKGSNILVEGRLKQETWEKDGQKRSKVKIVCDRLVMLGGKSSGERSGQPSRTQDTTSSYGSDVDDPDIPF